jgi:hypothetical protein
MFLKEAFAPGWTVLLHIISAAGVMCGGDGLLTWKHPLYGHGIFASTLSLQKPYVVLLMEAFTPGWTVLLHMISAAGVMCGAVHKRGVLRDICV